MRPVIYFDTCRIPGEVLARGLFWGGTVRRMFSGKRINKDKMRKSLYYVLNKERINVSTYCCEIKILRRVV
jgi:hypothetical protein